MDIAVPEGTPVRAMTSGTVRFAGEMVGYGRVVVLDHRGGWSTLYAHLSEIHVRGGRNVDGRTILGLSGRSGDVTSPHLHFEARAGTRPRDPVPLLGGPPPPHGSRSGR